MFSDKVLRNRRLQGAGRNMSMYHSSSGNNYSIVMYIQKPIMSPWYTVDPWYTVGPTLKLQVE